MNEDKPGEENSSVFSVGQTPPKESGKSHLELKDGSVFSLGGVQSSLSLLVDAEKIPTSSKLIHSESQEQEREEGEKPERYSIQTEITRGGMGAILKARDNDLRRAIAMKVMLKGLDAPVVEYERFVKEAQITGYLEHPNIVPVHELGVDKNNRPFFTMKLVGGESLQSIVKKIHSGSASYRQKYPLNTLLRILTQVCNAVSFAHSRGVVHRDIKPDNIMVGDFGEVLVMDWGLAKIKDLEDIQVQRPLPSAGDITKTIEGSILGTPAYMSPEQARGDITATDERSDVFSLGAVLHEILSGRPPYDGSSIMEVTAKAARGVIKDHSLANAPSELAKICLKALKESKENRYPSVKDLASVIEAFLEHRVIPEYSIKPWQKLLQSLGIIALFALFAFLIPMVSVPGFKMNFPLYFYLPALIAILGFGLSYQVMVCGARLSFFGRLQRLNRSAAKTAGSIKLQEGSLLGGILVTTVGLISILTHIKDKSVIGIGMSLALLTILYIYPLFLVLRLDYIREARQNALFGIISPNRFSTFMQMVLLYVIPFLPFIFIIVTIGPGDSVSISTVSVDYIISRSLYITVISLILGLVYFRIVFTFKELWAALGHLFSYLAGGQVTEENRVHASSVIRFLTETFTLWILSSCLLSTIGLLSTIQEFSEFLEMVLLVFCTSTLALLFYVLIVFVLIRRFAGDGGFEKANNYLWRSVMTFYKKHYGCFWSQSRYGITTIVLATSIFFAFGVLALITSAVSIKSVAFLLSLIFTLGVIGVGTFQRRRYRKLFDQLPPESQ